MSWLTPHKSEEMEDMAAAVPLVAPVAAVAFHRDEGVGTGTNVMAGYNS